MSDKEKIEMLLGSLQDLLVQVYQMRDLFPGGLFPDEEHATAKAIAKAEKAIGRV